MKYALSPEFFDKLKKLDVRTRKSFKQQILIFSEHHTHPQLNNHSLRDPYLGYMSIDITNDYRALYKEITVSEETVAYFVDIDTHEKLYSPKQVVIKKAP